jgi:archaellum component FlaC
MKVTGQAVMPDELIKNPLKEQLKYLEGRTIIYENYRAIREDMFQKLKSNVNDSLSAADKKIAGLKKTASELNLSLDSLRANLQLTKTSLEEMTRTKNRLKVIGLNVNKDTYNGIMWTILGGLVALLLIGFLVFQRNLSTTSNTKKEFQELKNEFEAYRKTTREAREKLTMDHFNEIKRLKGGG